MNTYKMSIALALVVLGIGFAGCSQQKSGGPGAEAPKPADTQSPSIIQSKGTFSLDVPMLAVKLKRGEAKAFSISVTRGEGMNQDVTLSFGNLPAGVTIEPANPTVKNTETEAKLTVKASPDAPVGDFDVKVTGSAGSGPNATSDLKVSVSEV